MAALYSNPGSGGKKTLKYNFLSLYKDENNNIRFEQQEALSDLTHNAVMEEFDSLYDREQEMLYGRN